MKMTVKAGLSYNITIDRIDGFYNMGSIGCSQAVGKQALMCMATGLFSNWKKNLFGILLYQNQLHVLKT